MERLQRQRALLHEHLRWLESEIAAEASTPPAKAGVSSEAAPAETTPVPAAAQDSSSIAAAPALEMPEADVRGIHSDVRGGCLLYFAIACAALGIAVGYIYWRY